MPVALSELVDLVDQPLSGGALIVAEDISALVVGHRPALSLAGVATGRRLSQWVRPPLFVGDRIVAILRSPGFCIGATRDSEHRACDKRICVGTALSSGDATALVSAHRHPPVGAAADDRFAPRDVADRTIELATFHTRGSGGLGVAACRGEQPRGRPAVAWLSLSGSGSPR